MIYPCRPQFNFIKWCVRGFTSSEKHVRIMKTPLHPTFTYENWGLPGCTLHNPQVCTRITVCVCVCVSVCLSPVSKNAYNSWTAWHILIKFSILIHVKIIYRLLCITVFFWWTRVENLGSVSENAHNSWTPWYIQFKFCILIYFNIVQPLPCKTVTRLHRASF